MKVILEFNLPEDKNASEIAVKSMDYAIAWFELNSWLRNQLKYSNLDEKIQTGLEMARVQLSELENDYQLPRCE